jgi:two-component system, sensor histidine kinase and response regulator
MEAPPAARLLIVDDEEAQMKALCHTLGERGFITTGCSSGEAALAALSRQKFDLLLSDLMMPGMDGITLLRAALQTDPDLIGIIMTGEGTITSAVEAMKLGAFDYILKPFKLSVILPVLSRALTLKNLRTRNAILEARVRERSAELEASNRELEAFSYSVSHDLRAPLRHISGFSDILTTKYSDKMPEEAAKFLGMINTSVEHMARLIEDLLRLARLGMAPLSRQPVDVSGLVREVLEELMKGQEGISVETRIGNLPPCVGDYALLKQVFINLLSNAVKFSRNAKGPLIEAGFKEQNGERVYFVRDNGAGFNMRNAEKLFGVFQRFHRADEFEGTGVGLSIVQRIIHRHGGRIWAESEVGQGATFFFTLPAGQPIDDSKNA